MDKQLNFRERLRQELIPILLYSCFTNEKQLIGILNTNRFSYLLPSVEMKENSIILTLNLDNTKINNTLEIEKKPNNSFVIKQIH